MTSETGHKLSQAPDKMMERIERSCFETRYSNGSHVSMVSLKSGTACLSTKVMSSICLGMVCRYAGLTFYLLCFEKHIFLLLRSQYNTLIDGD